MKKTTKGALAAGAAAVLLMGGAGSLAYWTDSGTITSATIASGNMSMTDPDCSGGWVYAAGAAGAGNAVTAFVPGDVVSETCTFAVNGTGDNLSATLTAPDTVAITSPTGTSLTATVAAAYSIGGAALTSPATITSAQFGQTVTATVTVTFPYGTDETGTVNTNDTQNIQAQLDDIAITLQQNNPNA